MDKYSIGIDLGTNSSGIAVIGDDFKLKKYKGKNIWSVMKFDSAKTAEKRRSYRGARRINTRRKKRIINLNNILENEVLKKDNSFFHRLEDSFKHLQDRVDKNNKYNLFVEKEFTDREYYAKYPTIYHLRNDLIDSKERKDIRLIYLALHHILKYRGNFLYEGQDFSKILNSKEKALENLINKINEDLNINITVELDQVLKILIDKDKTNKDKVLELKKLQEYSKEEKVKITEIFNAMVGLKFTVKKIYPETEFEEIEKLKISDEDIDIYLEEINEKNGEEGNGLLDYAKELYGAIVLEEILGGAGEVKNISKAMIEKYEKFKVDLRCLKDVIREYGTKKQYFEIFKSEELGKANYYSFVNTKVKGKNLSEQRKAFYKKIQELLKDNADEKSNYILKEIEKDRFLIKINTTINSYLPYQVHENELKLILDNQQVHYQVLKENREKILSILKFRIPYYVGPLGKEGEFKWMERKRGKEDEKIYPWNFKEIVDIDKSAENFIIRMTSYCSYIPEEKTLPLRSILYTEYCYYNEVNKIKFAGKTLDSKLKEKLKEDLFMKKKEISKEDLIKWYGANTPIKNAEVTGFMGNEKVLATLKPIQDFTKIYGKITSENREEIEKVIYWLTVFEDKKIVKRKLKAETKLTEDSIKKILKLNYKGFGKLSEKLLLEIKAQEGRYYRKSIMEILKESNLNFMQIVNDNELGLNKVIDKINGSEEIESINFEEHIKPLQGSPALKRGIYQAIKQIREVIRIMGYYPENIFIEFAREEGKPKRTIDKRETILKLYEGIDKKSKEDNDIIEELKVDDVVIGERLQLYLLQRGRCMYTNKPLEISNLSLYEIDHIIPRSLIKDNSIDNKVLVMKKANQEKEDGTIKVGKIAKGFWEELLKYKMISRRKYEALKKMEKGYNKNEIKGFINRQLVEVRQITKHVANLLNRCYGKKGTKVYSIKAELVNNFKEQYKIYKSREVNDMHHAKDAYAVAVVGLYINKRFNKLNTEFIYDDYDKKRKNKKEVKDTKKNKFGFIISSMNWDYVNEETGEVVWSKDEEISKIKKIFAYNDCLVVKKTEIMNGQMFEVTRCKADTSGKKVEIKIPLKNSIKEYLDVSRYGFYKGIKYSYFAIIENIKKEQRIIGIPIMIAKKNSKEIEAIINKIYGDVKIVKNKIPKYQKFRYENHEYLLISQNEWCNAKQLIVSQKIYEQICIIGNEKKFNIVEDKKNVLDEVISYLLSKLKSEYGCVYRKTIKDLEEAREVINEMENDDKKILMYEILNLMEVGSGKANLTKIGKSKESGKLNGRKDKDAKKIEFIYESYLGIDTRGGGRRK